MSWEDFVQSIENKKQQLDAVRGNIERFLATFKTLPPDIAAEARELLAAEMGLSSSTPSSREMADTRPTKQDFVGKPALECARIILREHGNKPQHFNAIAKESMRRGYKGRSEGTRQNSNRLDLGLEEQSEQKNTVSVQRDSWAGRAAVVLKKAGHQMTIDEIMAELQKLHLSQTLAKPTVFSGIWRRRDDLFVLHGRKGIALRTTEFTLI